MEPLGEQGYVTNLVQYKCLTTLFIDFIKRYILIKITCFKFDFAVGRLL